MKIEKTLPNYIIQGVEYLEFSNLGLLCTLTYTYFEKVRLSCDSTYSICADYCMDTDDTFSPCTFGKRIAAGLGCVLAFLTTACHLFYIVFVRSVM